MQTQRIINYESEERTENTSQNRLNDIQSNWHMITAKTRPAQEREVAGAPVWVNKGMMKTGIVAWRLHTTMVGKAEWGGVPGERLQLVEILSFIGQILTVHSDALKSTFSTTF